MKTLNDYLAMSYRLEIVRDDAEGGFVASYPDLPGCITCGETEEEAVKNALDAKKVWLEAALEDGLAIPAPDSLEAYRAVQAAPAPQPAPLAGRAFAAGGYQHEPVLRVSSGEKRCTPCRVSRKAAR